MAKINLLNSFSEIKTGSPFKMENSFVDELGNKVSADFKGRRYQVISYHKAYSCGERARRGLLAVLAVVASLGFALLAPNIRKLLVKSQKTVRAAVLSVPPKKSTLTVETETKPQPVPEPTHEVKKEEPQEVKPPKPAIRLVPKPPEGVIKNGYGEYLVYRKDQQGNKAAITEKEYESIFEVIETARKEVPADRHAYLEAKIQEKLGKEVRISFIPRNLYELIFLHECLQEDIEQGQCSNARELGITMGLQRPLKEEGGKLYGAKIPSLQEGKEIIDRGIKQGFWQLCIFDDQDHEDGFKKINENDYRMAHLVKVAAKLNEVALGKLKGQAEGYTYSDIAQSQKNEVAFFRSLTEKNSENHAKANIRVFTIASLALRFRNEQHPINGHDLYPLGIRNERDEEILNKATQLECSAESVNHLVLYRGAKFDSDELMRKKSNYSAQSPVLPNTLSYGTSLYGGALYDGGATAAFYMRKNHVDAQAFLVPLKEQLAGTTPFHAYIVNPLISLAAHGEVFHARSKLWKMPEEAKVLGFVGIAEYKYNAIKACVKTEKTQEEISKSFAEYKNKAYLLASVSKST